MTTVQIQLPDALVQEAERAGLLAPEAMERILRDKLKAIAWEQLKDVIDRVNANPDPNAMSPEEVADFIKRIRTEERLNARTQ